MQKKKGISLIVLVITIIVMVILAGAIVLTLNNSGIIDRASEAVDKTNEATVMEVAQLGWAEAYTEHGADKVKLEEGVKNALTRNGINPEDYVIKVTTDGVTIKKRGEPKAKWVKEGFTVVRGEEVLQIGDTINYDETAGGTKTGLTNVEWKVLGVDEDGNLLIMSATNVKESHRLGYDETDITDEEKLEETQNDWLNGPEELNTICEPYGYGEGTVGVARSITVEDVNKITGYDLNTYATGTLGQYGNVVTYKYNGTTTPSYTSVVTGDEQIAFTLIHSNGFYYYNEEAKKFEHITDLTTGTNGNVFATLTNNSYYYEIDSTKLSEKAYQMLCGGSYWHATRSILTSSTEVLFGMRFYGWY